MHDDGGAVVCSTLTTLSVAAGMMEQRQHAARAAAADACRADAAAPRVQCVAVGSTDGTVHVWEVASGALVCVLPHSKVSVRIGSADPMGPSHAAAAAAAAAASAAPVLSVAGDGIVGLALPMSPQRRVRGPTVASPPSDGVVVAGIGALAVGGGGGVLSPTRPGQGAAPSAPAGASTAPAAAAATSALPTTSVTAIVALPGCDLVSRECTTPPPLLLPACRSSSIVPCLRAQVCTGSDDGFVWLWNARSGTKLRQLRGMLPPRRATLVLATVMPCVRARVRPHGRGAVFCGAR